MGLPLYVKYSIASMIDTVTVELDMPYINLDTSHAAIDSVENEDSASKSSDK